MHVRYSAVAMTMQPSVELIDTDWLLRYLSQCCVTCMQMSANMLQRNGVALLFMRVFLFTVSLGLDN